MGDHVTFEIELFALLVQPLGFRPNLILVVLGKVPTLPLLSLLYLHDPVPSISGNVAEIPALTVHGGNDDALPGVALHHSSITRSVLIVRGGQEGFHGFNVRFLHARQLCDLDDPVALQLLRAGFLVHVLQRQGFAVILIPDEVFEQGAFADSLHAIQYQNGIKLDAGTHDACHRSRKSFAGDYPHILRVLCLQALNQNLLHPLHAVPGRERLKVVADRMEGAVIRNLGKSHIVIACGEGKVAAVE